MLAISDKTATNCYDLLENYFLKALSIEIVSFAPNISEF